MILKRNWKKWNKCINRFCKKPVWKSIRVFWGNWKNNSAKRGWKKSSEESVTKPSNKSMRKDSMPSKTLSNRFLLKSWKSSLATNSKVLKRFLPDSKKSNKSINRIPEFINHFMRIQRMFSSNFWEIWRINGHDNNRFWTKRTIICKKQSTIKQKRWNLKCWKIQILFNNYRVRVIEFKSKTLNWRLFSLSWNRN